MFMPGFKAWRVKQGKQLVWLCLVGEHVKCVSGVVCEVTTARLISSMQRQQALVKYADPLFPHWFDTTCDQGGPDMLWFCCSFINHFCHLVDQSGTSLIIIWKITSSWMVVLAHLFFKLTSLCYCSCPLLYREIMLYIWQDFFVYVLSHFKS